MFKNLIWDFDGTLLETYSQIFACYQKVIEYYGLDVDISIAEEIFRRESGKEAIEYIIKNTNVSYDDFLKKYEEFSRSNEIIKTGSVYEGTIDLLEDTLKNNIKNYIVTNRNDTILVYLKVFNLEKYFEDVLYIGKYGMRDRKPSPNGYKYIISKYNMNLDETLSIGDTDLDIKTSQLINLKTCLIRPIDNYNSKPDYIVQNAQELRSIVIS